MAIKEFIIGPQDYFEAGYFDGDYTVPNVSKSFLECDIDKIRGGRVITGEYYLGEYIDGSYYHNNTSNFAMTVDAMVVQDAVIGLNNYFTEGYFFDNYTQPQGSQFQMVVELTSAGEVVESTGSWSSEFSTSIAAGVISNFAASISSEFSTTANSDRIRDCSASIVSEFAQETRGTRLKDIDLFAFGEAAIAAEVNRIADNNVAVSVNFDIATDGRRFRDIAAAEDAVFDIDLVNSRSRAFTIETQAAFSLTANAREVVTITPATFTVAATTTVTAKRYRGITKTLSAVASITAIQYPTPQDINYPITNRALLHMDSDPFVDAFGGTISNASGGTLVSGKFGNAIGYPATLASITNGSGLFDSLFEQTAWSVDFWWKPRDLTTGTNVMPTVGILALSNGATGGPYDSDIVLGWEQTSLVSSNSAAGHIYLGYWWSKFAQSSQTSYTYNATTKDANEWKHVAITYQNLGSVGGGLYNLRIGVFVNGVGSFTNVSSVGDYGVASTSLYLFPTLSPVTDRDGLGSYSRSFQGYIDELNFRPGVAYTGNFTPPTAAYAPAVYYSAGGANIQAVASLSATPIFVVRLLPSTISSAFTQAATASRTRTTASSVSSAFTQSATIGLKVSASAVLASSFTTSASAITARTTSASVNAAFGQTTNGTRIRYAAVSVDATASVNAAAVKTVRTIKTLTSEFAQSTVNDRIRYADLDFEAIATEVTAAARNATGTVSIDSVFTTTAVAEKITDAPQSLASEFTVDNINSDRIRDNVIAAQADTTFAIEFERIQPAGADLVSTAEMSVTVSKFTGYTVEVSDQFTQTTDTLNSRTRDLVSESTITTSLLADNQVLRLAAADLVAVCDIVASPTFIVRITADFLAFNTQLTVGDVINIDPFLQIKVKQETRLGTVLPEQRRHIVEQETRVNIIQGY